MCDEMCYCIGCCGWMGMQVGCVYVVVYCVVLYVVYVLVLVYLCGLIVIGECDCGLVEFMFNYVFVDGVQC